MTEDFIIEEESENPTTRRAFLTAVGILLAIFVLAVICSGTLLLTRGSRDGNAEQIAAIETQNAIVAVTNEAVTQTVAAMETGAARPTNTPIPPATNTPVPTNTALPTNTPVIKQAEEEAMTTPTTSGTSIFAGGTANTPTPISSQSGNGDTGNALPQTGIETWGAFVAAFILIAVLWTARRIRNG